MSHDIPLTTSTSRMHDIYIYDRERGESTLLQMLAWAHGRRMQPLRLLHVISLPQKREKRRMVDRVGAYIVCMQPSDCMTRRHFTANKDRE